MGRKISERAVVIGTVPGEQLCRTIYHPEKKEVILKLLLPSVLGSRALMVSCELSSVIPGVCGMLGDSWRGLIICTS